MIEKRRHPRFDLQFPVSFAPDGTQWWGDTLNISLGGCAVASEGAVTTGSALGLHLYLPGDPAPITIERAPVRWTAFRRFGVEFLRMPGEAQERLRYFVSGL